jgi:hypothetical protein
MAEANLICVNAISPTYEPIHRYVYYVSLLLSVIYPTPPPLVKGAFAFSLTYSSTAALYAILLLSITPKSPTSTSSSTTTNLDIPALYAILSAAAIVVLPLQTWTKSLSRSARNIIRVWVVFITIGLCCTFVLLVRSKALASPAQRIASDSIVDVATCEASASATHMKFKLRDPQNVEVADFDRVFGDLYTIAVKKLSPLVFLPLVFGLLACLVTVHPSKNMDHRPNGSVSNSTYSSNLEFGLGAGVSSASLSSKKSPSRQFFLWVRNVLLGLTPAFWIAVVVVNELYLLKGGAGGIPEVEGLYEVGQWSLLTGLGFVAAAAAWNAVTVDGSGRG